MSIFLTYVVIVQIMTIVFFKEFNVFILFLLMIPFTILLLNKKWLLLLYCIATVVITSCICFYLNEIVNSPKPKPNHVVQGEILTTPIIDGNKISFTFKLNQQKIMVVSFADLESDISTFQKREVGDICLLKGETTKPKQNTIHIYSITNNI